MSLTEKTLNRYLQKKKAQDRCDNHPDPDVRHIYSIAGIYMHDQLFRRKYDRPDHFTKKTYTLKPAEIGQYITHNQLRKIYKSQLNDFL